MNHYEFSVLNTLELSVLNTRVQLVFAAIAIKESAKIGDKATRRSAKGIDDLGKN